MPTLRSGPTDGAGAASQPPASSGCAVGSVALSAAQKPPADWELVLKRNPVERLKKREGAARDPRRAAGADRGRATRTSPRRTSSACSGGASTTTSRRSGRSCCGSRSRRASCRRTELRTIGEVSNLYGKGDGELSTRQNIQLHWLELAKLPDVFAHLERSGVTTAGGCGDTVRNITGCPVQGIAADELFDASPIVDRRRRPLLRQPRLGEPAAEAQVLDLRLRRPLQRARDQLHLADRHRHDDGREGFAVLVGGGLSSVPRIARDMGVFIPKEDANEILGAITSVWSEDLKYRVSRVKARLKFMVDDIGAGGDPRARRGPARPQARGLLAAADRRSSRRTTSASTRRSRRGSRTSASPSTSA